MTQRPVLKISVSRLVLIGVAGVATALVSVDSKKFNYFTKDSPGETMASIAINQDE